MPATHTGRNTIFLVFLLTAVHWSANLALAGEIFFDSFADPVLTNVERHPVTWSGFEDGDQISVVDGDLVVGGSSYPAASVVGLNIGNTSVRTQLRLRSGDAAVVYARTTAIPGRKGYFASLSADGTARIGFDGTGEVIATTNTEFRPEQEDVVLQFDAINNELSLWLWRPGHSVPADPILSQEETSGFVGGVDVGAFGSGEVVFRYVQVADVHIPEAGTASLAGMAFLGLLARQRNRASSPSDNEQGPHL